MFPDEIIVFCDMELQGFNYPFVLAVQLTQITFRRKSSLDRRRDGLLLGTHSQRQLSSIMRILILNALKLRDGLTGLLVLSYYPKSPPPNSHSSPSSQTVFIACFRDHQCNCFSKSAILKLVGVMDFFELFPKATYSNSRQKLCKPVYTTFFNQYYLLHWKLISFTQIKQKNVAHKITSFILMFI